MCIVIDTNVISKVLEKSNKQHQEFQPIHEWIYKKNGKIMFGGSQYIKENLMGKYRALFVQLSTARKTIPLDNKKIDEESKRLKKLAPEEAFDDPHIVAILKIGKSRLLCTDDEVLIKYVRKFFPNKKTRPHIYKSAKNKSLLNTKNIPLKYR